MITLAAYTPFLVIAILLAFFGAIALAVYLLRKHLPFLKDDEKPLNEEEIASEELNRILVPVNDDEKEFIEEEKISKEAAVISETENKPDTAPSIKAQKPRTTSKNVSQKTKKDESDK